MKKVTAIVLFIAAILILCTYFKELLTTDSKVTIVENNNEENILLEEYIIGVVACEMPALFEEEALKAQAIASRTYALYKTSNDLTLLTTTSDQCYIDEVAMKKKWGSDFNKYYKRIKDAVNATKNTFMLKDKELFKAFYFAISNGYTEESQYVFKEASLASVSSLWDKEVKNYEVTTKYIKEDLVEKLGDFNNIKILSRNKTNHVEYVSVDNKLYTGIEIRKLLQLRSTDFKINKKDNLYEITTFGYGHGVGMSQYGANELAKQGYDYKYILNYYYSGVEFSNNMYNL